MSLTVNVQILALVVLEHHPVSTDEALRGMHDRPKTNCVSVSQLQFR